jgi:hypothetical protein
MNDLDFIDKMLGRFQRKDGANRESIISQLDVFCGKCPEIHYQEIYEFSVQNLKFFNINKIFDYAKLKGFVDAKNHTENVIYWRVCKKCKTEYSKHGRGCPRCRSTESTIKTGESIPDNVIDAREDCFYCEIYKESVKKCNDKKMYFQGCGDYGIKQDAKCSACQCRECCRQMMMHNADSRGSIEKYQSTELAQPWIIDVPPLNDTVKQMIEDIKTRPYILSK